MFPLKEHSLKLSEGEMDLLANFLTVGNNPSICTVCNKQIFIGSTCELCKFNGKSVRDVFIESLVPHIIRICRNFRSPKFEDLVSVGLITAIQTVDELNTRIINPCPYIFKVVRYKLKRYLTLDSLIRLPRFNYKKNLWLRTVFQYDDAGDTVNPVNFEDYCDLKELIAKVPKTEIEETILQYTFEGGYTLKEIAAELPITDARVSQIKAGLLTRLREEILHNG